MRPLAGSSGRIRSRAGLELGVFRRPTESNDRCGDNDQATELDAHFLRVEQVHGFNDKF